MSSSARPASPDRAHIRFKDDDPNGHRPCLHVLDSLDSLPPVFRLMTKDRLDRRAGSSPAPTEHIETERDRLAEGARRDPPPLPFTDPDRFEQSARKRDAGGRLPEASVRLGRHTGEDVCAGAVQGEPGGEDQGQRQEAADSADGPHRRGWRAAREVAGRSVRRRREGWLRLGQRLRRRQGRPEREPDGDAADQALGSGAGPRRHLSRRIGRRGNDRARVSSSW